MAKQRLFNLPETKGNFQLKGVVSGVKSNKFYTVNKTRNGTDMKNVNFGCAYDDKKNVYLNLNGMPQQSVYFSKKNPTTQKNETKQVDWVNRNKFNEEGYRLIGVNLGLTKVADENGKMVNDKKTMAPFDACDYIKENLQDDMSVFIRGNLEFSSYVDKNGNKKRNVRQVPSQISLCAPVDFEEYSDNNKPVHDFEQTIVFWGIEKEDGRAVVSAKIVTYNSIEDAVFYVTNPALANSMRKKLKIGNAIKVHGKIEVRHNIDVVEVEDEWGEKNPMKSVNGSSVTEMIITGASPETIDTETYSEANIAAAIKAVNNAKNAEKQFAPASNTDSEIDWGDEAEDDESPWDF